MLGNLFLTLIKICGKDNNNGYTIYIIYTNQYIIVIKMEKQSKEIPRKTS